jgi:hypothetical protein
MRVLVPAGIKYIKVPRGWSGVIERCSCGSTLIANTERTLFMCSRLGCDHFGELLEKE